MQKTIKKFLHAAHLAAAITVGLALTGLDAAPVRTIFITGCLFVFLYWSYTKLYPKPFIPKTDTPIDEQVRRDLGIKD